MHRIFVFFLSLCSLANAETLSFDDCVREASSSNQDLLAQKSTVNSLEIQLTASYSNFYPHVSGSLNVNYGNSAANGSNLAWSVAPAASLSQNLFNGFADKAKVDIAKANLEVAQAELEAVKSKISSDLKIAFAALVYAQNSEILSNEIKDRRGANYKLVSLLFESGRENYGSVLLAKAYLGQAEFQITQAQNATRTASVQLAKMLGRDYSEDLRVSGTVPMSVPEDKPDFKNLFEKVPSYIKAQAQEKIALAQKSSALAPFYPTVDFVANANVASRANSTSSQWLVGLSIHFPFFDGGRDYYGLKNASQGIVTAQLNKLVIQRANTSSLRSTYTAYTESLKQLDVDKSFREALATQEKIATADYNNGFLSFQNWDIIETGYITRQLAVLVDERNLVNAEAAWQLAKGIGVIP